MMNQYFDNTTKVGTAGGTLLTILANITSEDIIKRHHHKMASTLGDILDSDGRFPFITVRDFRVWM